MPLPLAIAAPAALTAVAYLNAKLGLSHDYRTLSSIIRSEIVSNGREKRDRLNLYYLLEERALSLADASRSFLVYEGREVTYKETYDIVLRYGQWLRARHNVQKGDVVAMDIMNSLEFVFVWFGVWSIGAVPAFINYNLAGKSLVHCIKISTARLVLVDQEVQDSVTEEVRNALGDSMDFQILSQGLKEEIAQCEAIRQDDALRSGAIHRGISILIFTSGTTGMPKAGVVGWNKTSRGGFYCANWSSLRKDDRYYTCMPLYHGTAALVGACASLNAGCTLVIGHRFSTKTFWPEVRASNATVIQYVGETCRYLLAAPPQLDLTTGEDLDKQHVVRMAFGNGMRPDVWTRFKERFGIETIAEFYSATESPSGSWNYSNNELSAGAIGRFGTILQLMLTKMIVIVKLDWEAEVPLRDEKTGFCKKVATGAPGEILFQVDAHDIDEKYQGYYSNKEASNKKVIRDVLTKGDAYFRSGDIVRWDSEGRLFFQDRIGDTFRWKGENVATSEVAETLSMHRSIEEANVYGISLPYHDGRAGCAALVLSQEPKQDVLESLLNIAKGSLPRYAVPLFLRVAKSLERTGTNKQQKHILRTEGVDPAKTKDSQIFWLSEGQYVPFREQDWQRLNAGQVRL